MSKLSIIPPTGEFGTSWPNNSNLPQGIFGTISAADWTYGNEGFVQQTFLGASIRDFNINAGFGDTSSTLSVNLVADEYNIADRTGIGFGDDIYHNGLGDVFMPPAVGSPVFFKFGQNFATIEQAWRPIFDILYNINTIIPDSAPTQRTQAGFPSTIAETEFVDLDMSSRSSNTFNVKTQPAFSTSVYNIGSSSRGMKHIVFGGILQSYVETKGSNGNPLYSVQLVDPREILSNVQVILNNYTGSIYNNKNYLNVYGFLEYALSQETINLFCSAGEDRGLSCSNVNFLKKIVDDLGNVSFSGNDLWVVPNISDISELAGVSKDFPYTGPGMSRVTDNGIPWYRVNQALAALFEYHGKLPEEYKQKSFGGPINFRGYNYVVDFTGIPLEKIPQMYFLNFDKIDLLSLAQELCDVISHDLYISLLPIINHPACEYLFNKNLEQQDPTQIIAGIIRIDAINRTDFPAIGSVKNYLNELSSRGVQIQSQDLGYELSNVETDKIVVGAQEVEIYFFSGERDRDKLQLRKKNSGQLPNQYEALQDDQWLLETSLSQQILPFYGFLDKDVPTIPRGFGPYQQILLDSSNLDAFGVGYYYIATEMELRCALSSYEDWKDFLLGYNDIYIEEVGDNQAFYKGLEGLKQYNKEFGVSVPRCVFVDERSPRNPDGSVLSERGLQSGNGHPLNPCAPPFGYPLYYKRAERIGIPEAGILSYQNDLYKIITDLSTVEEISRTRDEYIIKHGQQVEEIRTMESLPNETMQSLAAARDELDRINKAISQAETANDTKAVVRKILKNKGVNDFIKNINSLAYESKNNAKKVYDFVRNVAEKHLGKTFLVKIPVRSNLMWDNKIFNSIDNTTRYGPYGFTPVYNCNDLTSCNKMSLAKSINTSLAINLEQKIPFFHYLWEWQLDTKINISEYNDTLQSIHGDGWSINNNGIWPRFNPINSEWTFNYKPEPQGGFFKFDLMPTTLFYGESLALPNQQAMSPVQKNMLAPLDLTNFQENSRIKSYVRFDHSEFLDFSSIGKEDVYQQIITPNGMIPDVLEELNNINNVNLRESFETVQRRIEHKSKPPSIAFVKCDVDEKIYLLPRIESINVGVTANEISLNLIQTPGSLKTINNNGCLQYVAESGKEIPVCTILPTATEVIKINEFKRRKIMNGADEIHLIQTSKETRSQDRAYAIITLPGRVIPTLDQRYLDGPFQAMQGVSIKHAMTSDVVTLFKNPSPLSLGPNPQINCDKFTISSLAKAHRLHQETRKAIGITNPTVRIGYAQPSPVYPDLVAIPLMSTEKCYGPWFSSSIFNGQTNSGVRYSDIGGKVDFIKDENLAPWNFFGYQLMNEAGALQAQFSNGLLLFSERATFTLANNLTEGMILAKPIPGNGPLITSISVDIGDSVQTTVKMDLYTSKFGKLQKAKENEIAAVSRERQKIRDQQNKIIRSGVLKNRAIAGAFKKEFMTTANELTRIKNKDMVTHILSGPNGTAFMSQQEIEAAIAANSDIGQSHFAKNFQETSSISLTDLFTGGLPLTYNRDPYIEQFFTPPPTE